MAFNRFCKCLDHRGEFVNGRCERAREEDNRILSESGGEEPSPQLAAQQLHKYGRTGADVISWRAAEEKALR